MTSNFRDLRLAAMGTALLIIVGLLLYSRSDSPVEAREQVYVAENGVREAAPEETAAAPEDDSSAEAPEATEAPPQEQPTLTIEEASPSEADSTKAKLGGTLVFNVDQPGDQAQDDEAAKERKKKRETLEKSIHKVKREPFKVEVSLKGVFEASQMAEVVVRPEEWNELKVVEAVEQGTRVSQGDTLLELDTRKIDEAIRDLEESREMSYLAIRQAEEELALLEKKAPLDLERSERSLQMAREDLETWDNVERDLMKKSAEYALKSAEQWLENAREELRQLEKMYEADDLTEETEEIILKRQRAQVEFAEFSFERSQIFLEQVLTTGIPRRDEQMRHALRQQELGLERLQVLQPTEINRKRLELEKLRYEREKSDQRLQRLQSDRAALTVKAPADGIIYYGKCSRGNWPGASTMADRLRPGGSISANDVVMTVVTPRPIFIRATVPEKELRFVKTNLQGKAVPEGYPDLRLSAAVQNVSRIPVSDGNFEAKVSVDVNSDGALMPGMACNVKFVPYSKSAALVVPSSAVFTDVLDDERHYVYVVVDEVEHEKRYVTVGQKSDDKTEILEGLDAGDEVLTKKPDEIGK